MKTEEIIAGNRLLAEFMGWVFEPKNEWYCFDSLIKERARLPVSDVKYNDDWNWLMPVIEKIELSTVYNLTTNYDNREEFNGWSVHWFTFLASNEILLHIEDKRFETKIAASWYAVVEFVKWYNNNKNEQKMKTFIYTIKKNKAKYGWNFTTAIYLVENNIPQFILEICYNSGMYKGHIHEVFNALRKNGNITPDIAKLSSSDDYFHGEEIIKQIQIIELD